MSVTFALPALAAAAAFSIRPAVSLAACADRCARLRTYIPVRFSADGAALFVYERLTDSMSRVRIASLDLHTGRRTPWLEFTSPNRRALDVGNVDITPDGRSYIYCFDRFLSDLYIVDGLR